MSNYKENFLSFVKKFGKFMAEATLIGLFFSGFLAFKIDKKYWCPQILRLTPLNMLKKQFYIQF